MYFSAGETVAALWRQGHGLNDLFKPYLPRMDVDGERRLLQIDGQRFLVLFRPFFPSIPAWEISK